MRHICKKLLSSEPSRAAPHPKRSGVRLLKSPPDANFALLSQERKVNKSIVKRNLLNWLMLSLLLAGLPALGTAQKRRKTVAKKPAKVRTVQATPVIEADPETPVSVPAGPPLTVYQTTPAATSALLAALPASDGVAFIDVRRIIDEALPTLLASEPARLAQINAQLARFKQQTGLDPRSFERVALSFRFKGTEKDLNVDTLALVNGSFNAGALLAAGRISMKGKYQEEEYKGKMIYRFPLGEDVSVPLINMKGKELGVMERDANTLAIGDVATLKAALDSGMESPSNSAMVALATRNPNALIGFGGNVPAQVFQLVGMDTKEDEIGKTIGAIRQAAGSLSLTERGAQIALAARTEKEGEAKNLTDTLNALKQFGGVAIGQLKTPAQQKLAGRALESLTVNQNGVDTELSLEIRRSDFPALLGLFK